MRVERDMMQASSIEHSQVKMHGRTLMVQGSQLLVHQIEETGKVREQKRAFVGELWPFHVAFRNGEWGQQ